MHWGWMTKQQAQKAKSSAKEKEKEQPCHPLRVVD